MNSKLHKVIRGPYLSTSMPIIIRAGIVNATFIISRALTCCILRSNVCWIETISGAWLNQTKKLIKKASHVRWRVRMLPLNENRFILDWDIVVTLALFIVLLQRPCQLARQLLIRVLAKVFVDKGFITVRSAPTGCRRKKRCNWQCLSFAKRESYEFFIANKIFIFLAGDLIIL